MNARGIPRRFAAACLLEVRVHVRYRVTAVAVTVAAAWTGLLLLVPDPAATTLGGLVLLVDTATFGGFFIPALFVFERGDGAQGALMVSPLRFGEYLGAKLVTLTTLSILAAIPIAVAATRGQVANPWHVLLGVTLVAVLVELLAFLLVQPHRTLTGYLTTAPLVIAPLLIGPLVHITGILNHPVVYVFPTTGGADLILAGLNPEHALSAGGAAAASGYLLLWIAATAALGRRRFQGAFHPGRRGGARPRPARTREFRFARGGWVATFARVDLRSLRMDALLGFLVAVPVLLALALRFGYPPLVDHVRDSFGLDLAPYSSPILALTVIMHVPLIYGMITALLMLDDVAEGRLQLFSVTPVTLNRYLGYRVGFTGAVTLLGLLVAVPLSGLSTTSLPLLLPALLLATAVAPLVPLAAAAFATDRVRGIGLLKVISGLIVLVALVPWWLPLPVQWLLLALPPAAVTHLQRAAEAGEPIGILAGACAGGSATAGAMALLARRVIGQHART